MDVLLALSYIVTILGFPVAIYVFVAEERRRRVNEEKELHRQLSQEYDGFLMMVMQNADLLLLSRSNIPAPSEEQLERTEIIFRMLVSLFEKAYIILYTPDLTGNARRRWLSWEDDMREWCRRDDFRKALPFLLEGEDDEFSAYILAIAAEPSPQQDARGD